MSHRRFVLRLICSSVEQNTQREDSLYNPALHNYLLIPVDYVLFLVDYLLILVDYLLIPVDYVLIPVDSGV